MKYALKKYLLSLTFLLGTIYVFSQKVPPPPASPQSGDIGGVPDSPIDGYIFYLAIFAIAIIYYKYKKTYKAIKN